MSIEAAIMSLLAARGPGKSLSPPEIARALTSADEKLWSRLMLPIRVEAVRLAHAGMVTIVRKGKPIDPDTMRGLYRIALPVDAPDTDRDGAAGGDQA